jgi:hypothetical protein
MGIVDWSPSAVTNGLSGCNETPDSRIADPIRRAPQWRHRQRKRRNDGRCGVFIEARPCRSGFLA